MTSSEGKVIYDGLTLSGGGLKGIYTLGALHHHFENGVITTESVKELSGTSIGAAICLLLVCGYTPYEIFEDLRESLNSFIKYDALSMLQVTTTFGLCSMDPFINKITEMVLRKSTDGKIPTLKKLHDTTGKKLIVCVVNRTHRIEETYTHESHPGLSCVNAVKLSCSLPVIFPRMKYKDCYIVDGGLLNNVPHRYISDSVNKLLCIATIGGESKSTPDENIFTYVFDIINIPINHITYANLETIRPNSQTILIKHHGPLISTNITSDDAIDMFMLGNEVAEMVQTSVDVTLIV